MKSSILRTLTLIRLREQRKLIDIAYPRLKSSGPDNTDLSLEELINFLINLRLDYFQFRNYQTSLENYNKQSSTLLLLKKVVTDIYSHLYTVNKLQGKILDLHDIKPGELPEDNETARLLKHLENAILDIKGNLQELKQKITTSLPHQTAFRPLNPFIFTNHSIRIASETVGILILNENSGDHLAGLLDSFLSNNKYSQYKFYIADRNSTDNRREIIKSFSEELPIEFLSFDQSYTSSYLNNILVDQCLSEYILFWIRPHSSKVT